MFNCLHYETELIHATTLAEYRVEDNKDLFALPEDVLNDILYTEFNHTCEDVHFDLGPFEEWKEMFIMTVELEEE